MHRDSEGKGKGEGYVLPKELKSNAMKRCIKGNTLDIVKKAEADKGAKEAKGTRVCEDEVNRHSSKNQEL